MQGRAAQWAKNRGNPSSPKFMRLAKAAAKAKPGQKTRTSQFDKDVAAKNFDPVIELDPAKKHENGRMSVCMWPYTFMEDWGWAAPKEYCDGAFWAVGDSKVLHHILAELVAPVKVMLLDARAKLDDPRPVQVTSLPSLPLSSLSSSLPPPPAHRPLRARRCTADRSTS